MCWAYTRVLPTRNQWQNPASVFLVLESQAYLHPEDPPPHPHAIAETHLRLLNLKTGAVTGMEGQYYRKVEK